MKYVKVLNNPPVNSKEDDSGDNAYSHYLLISAHCVITALQAHTFIKFSKHVEEFEIFIVLSFLPRQTSLSLDKNQDFDFFQIYKINVKRLQRHLSFKKFT